jgi:D-alanyl-D-alanine carboxypeptidase
MSMHSIAAFARGRTHGLLRTGMVVWLFSCVTAYAQPLDAALASRLQGILDSMRTAHGIPGISAGVLIPGHDLWQGTAGGSRPGVPLTRDMLFGIGSNSKLFTAVAVLKCRENGLLRLDDSIGAWLPPMRNIDPAITTRQLLNHTSGISDVNAIPGYPDSILADPNRLFTREEVLSWVGPPSFAPGAAWEYSNTNYLLAGMIAERACGQPFASFLRDSILSPLRLDSTFLPPDEALAGMAADPWANNANISGTPRNSLHSTAWCAGAMFSTSSEMAQWYAALLGGQVLHPESFREMTTFVSSNAYAFGIAEKRLDGRIVWLHGGSIRGYSSQMMYDTAMHAVICVLTNETPAPAAMIAQLLLAALAGGPVTAIDMLSEPDHPFTVYPNPVAQRITIQRRLAVELHITDLIGCELWRGSGNGDVVIDVSRWTRGLHIIHSDRNIFFFVIE